MKIIVYVEGRINEGQVLMQTKKREEKVYFSKKMFTEYNLSPGPIIKQYIDDGWHVKEIVTVELFNELHTKFTITPTPKKESRYANKILERWADNKHLFRCAKIIPANNKITYLIQGPTKETAEQRFAVKQKTAERIAFAK